MKGSFYDRFLVRHRETLLAFYIIDNCDIELKEINKNKIGEPFHYTNAFLLLLVYAKVYFHLPYRQIEEGKAQEDMPR